MATEKNTIWTIQKAGEAVENIGKALDEFEKEYDKSDETTANIVRKAASKLLKITNRERGSLDGWMAAQGQAIDRQTDKLNDQITRLKEEQEENKNTIKKIKEELKEAQAIAKRNEAFPDKMLNKIEQLKEFIDAEAIKEKK